MLVTSWNSKATPDVPHPMSGHDFYSNLSTGLGGISQKKNVFLWFQTKVDCFVGMFF